MIKSELAVIGAGPAGLAAALTAAQAGVQVTLIDEYPKPGGQYLKGAAHPQATAPVSATERKGRALLRQLAQTDVTVCTGTLVWGIEGNGAGLRLALHGPEGSTWLEAQAVLAATGARELVLPFPGWTLPGVMTLGASQVLTKAHKVLPGKRVLLAGSGPLLLPTASALTRLGAEVVAVLEATRLTQWLRHGPAVWGQGERLREGWHYLWGMWGGRVPYRFGRTVVRAIGQASLTAAIIARLDRQGVPIPGSEETIQVDTLCLGFGLVPNVELTQLAGCAHAFDPTRGGWVPQVNEQLETTVPGLFAAGEMTGVDGAGAAMLEGHLAALAAAAKLGRIDADTLRAELTRAAGPRRRARRFGAMLNTLFAPRTGLDAITTDETLLCRCEEVTAGQVRTAIQAGAGELDALKTWTRIGQGPCQGRTCGPLLARFLARETCRPVAEAGLLHVRPPLKPIPLSGIAMEEKA
jgi:D-hydroxyproline dehydrogenase subunit alpha